MVSRQELQSRMTALEGVSSFGTDSNQELNELKSIALGWLKQTKAAPLALRFARLVRRIEGSAGQRAFLLETRKRFSDPSVDLALVAILIEEGNDAQAKELAVALCKSDLTSVESIKAARLLRRLHCFADSIAAFRHAVSLDQQYCGELISALLALGDRAAALNVAYEALAASGPNAATLFACYTAQVATSSPEEELANTRARVIAAGLDESDASYWEARLLRFERKYDAAISALDRALRENPQDSRLLKERAATMIHSGEWGKHGNEILSSKTLFPAGSELSNRAEVVHAFLNMFKNSENVGSDHRFDLSALRTPDAVFEHVIRSHPAVAVNSAPKRLVMVASSLGPGGAERVFATLAHSLASSQRFESIRLYFIDLSSAQRKDFYLPQIQFAQEDVYLLDRRIRVDPPLTFLPFEHGKTAQAVLTRLTQDRPDILYVALEPLTVFAALAGLLAGVPKIVMHSHNMPPTELHPRTEFPERLRECYRVLLTKPHISLLTCAKAASTAYAEWLNCGKEANISHIHNGLDFVGFDAEGGVPRDVSRGELHAKPNDLVIGTAFAFREEKQPLLWVDAAERIAQAKSNSRFVMFGDGVLWQQTRAYVAAKGLDDRFTFPGLVSDLYRRLPALDLFMLSSRSEALPNVLIEAQAASVPVVTTAVGGASETFLEGETGFLAQSPTSVGLADAALKALESLDWRQRASERGPGFVRARFSVESMTRSFVDALTS